MSNAWNSTDGLDYRGTRASRPINTYRYDRDPTIYDINPYQILDEWQNTETLDVWQLISLANPGSPANGGVKGSYATWVKTGGGSGDLITLSADDGNIALPLLGNILMHNTDGNILTTAATPNTVTYNFAPSIVVAQNITSTAGNLYMPNTTASFATGTINFGGSRFISNFGNNNTFMGHLSGVASGSGANNTGIGSTSLDAVTTGVNNTAVGSDALGSVTTGQNNIGIGQSAVHSLSTGNDNTGIGAGVMPLLTSGIQNISIGSLSGTNLLTGNNNVLIGPGTGVAYASNESANFIVQHTGVVGDQGVIRLGTSPTTTANYQAGITGVGVTGSAVIVASDGQLGITVSSLRYKENIRDFDLTTKQVLSLRPVKFNYKGRKSDDCNYGLIAEEVEKVIPELVVKNKSGEAETVRYHELCIYLLNVIKDLDKRVEQLELKQV